METKKPEGVLRTKSQAMEEMEEENRLNQFSIIFRLLSPGIAELP